jgi:uncharacterized protein (DUF2345 family)
MAGRRDEELRDLTNVVPTSVAAVAGGAGAAQQQPRAGPTRIILEPDLEDEEGLGHPPPAALGPVPLTDPAAIRALSGAEAEAPAASGGAAPAGTRRFGGLAPLASPVNPNVSGAAPVPMFPDELPSTFWIKHDTPGIHLAPSALAPAPAFEPTAADKELRKLKKDLRRQQLMFFGVISFVMIVGIVALVMGSLYLARKVGQSQIQDGAVGTSSLGDGSVTSDKLQGGSVTSAAIANGTITGDKIADGSVPGNKLFPESVTSAELAPGSITTAKIADEAVTDDKVSSEIETAIVYGRRLNTTIQVTDDGLELGVPGRNFTLTRPDTIGGSATRTTVAGQNSGGLSPGGDLVLRPGSGSPTQSSGTVKIQQWSAAGGQTPARRRLFAEPTSPIGSGGRTAIDVLTIDSDRVLTLDTTATHVKASNGSVTVSSGLGDISVSAAAGTVSIAGNAGVSVASAGAGVSITGSGSDVTIASNTRISGSAPVVSLSATAGILSSRATSDVTVTSSGGDVITNANSDVTTTAALGDVSLTATLGNVHLKSPSATVDLTSATGIVATASTGDVNVQATNGNILETAKNNVGITAQTGKIQLTATANAQGAPSWIETTGLFRKVPNSYQPAANPETLNFETLQHSVQEFIGNPGGLGNDVVVRFGGCAPTYSGMEIILVNSMIGGNNIVVQATSCHEGEQVTLRPKMMGRFVCMGQPTNDRVHCPTSDQLASYTSITIHADNGGVTTTAHDGDISTSTNRNIQLNADLNIGATSTSGNINLQANGGTVGITAATGGSITVNQNDLTLTTGQGAIRSASKGDVNVLSATPVMGSSPSTSLTLDPSGSTTLQNDAGDTVINTPNNNIVVSTKQLRLNGMLTQIPQKVDMTTVGASTYVVDFALAISSTFVFATSGSTPVGDISLNFVNCNNAYSGTTFTVYNDLGTNANLLVSSATCIENTALVIEKGKHGFFTCMSDQIAPASTRLYCTTDNVKASSTTLDLIANNGQLGLSASGPSGNIQGTAAHGVTFTATAGDVDLLAANGQVLASAKTISAQATGSDVSSAQAAIQLQAAGGSVQIQAQGVAPALSGRAALELSAATGAVLVKSAGANVAGMPAIEVQATAGTVQVRSDGLDYVDAALASAKRSAVSIDATQGSVAVNAAGPDVGASGTDAARAAVNIQATTGSAALTGKTGVTITGTAGPVLVHAPGTGAAGAIDITASGNTPNAINVQSQAGGVAVTASGPTGNKISIANINAADADAININSVAGGVAVGAQSSVHVTAAGSASDSIAVTAANGGITGSAKTVQLSSTATGASSLLVHSAGGVTVNADVDPIALTANSLTGKISLTSSAATDNAAVNLLANQGGVTIQANSADPEAIGLKATNGGISANAREKISIVSTNSGSTDAIGLSAENGGITVNAAKNDLTLTASGLSGRVQIVSTDATVADALAAYAVKGGVDIQAYEKLSVLSNAATDTDATLLQSKAGGVTVRAMIGLTAIAEGNAADAIKLDANLAGGIHALAQKGVVIDASAAGNGAIALNALNGGVDITGATDPIRLTASGAMNGKLPSLPLLVPVMRSASRQQVQEEASQPQRMIRSISLQIWNYWIGN